MVGHGRQVGERGFQIVEWLGNGKLRRVAVQRTHRIALLLLAPRQGPQRFFQVLFEFLDRVAHRPLRFLRPGVEFRRRHHLAVACRRHGEADRRAQNDDAVRLGFLIQSGEGLLILFLDRLLDRRTTLLVILAFEQGRQGDSQVVDQIVNRLGKRRRTAARQRNRDRAMRGVEVVDVDPVGGCGPRMGGIIEQRTHRLADTRTGRTDGEDVEALLRDCGAEADGILGARLLDQAGQRCQVRRGGELQRVEHGTAVEQVRRDRLDRWRVRCWHGSVRTPRAARTRAQRAAAICVDLLPPTLRILR